VKLACLFALNRKILFFYSLSDSGSVSLGDIQVRTLDLDNIKKKIRYDFEAFYATIYREMAASYEAKMTELEADVKEALQNQSAENEEFAMRIQIQQTEYEKAQKSLAYEREALTKLEHTYCKLSTISLFQFGFL
jgi:predicted nuclease with TOPRIM domain